MSIDRIIRKNLIVRINRGVSCAPYPKIARVVRRTLSRLLLTRGACPSRRAKISRLSPMTYSINARTLPRSVPPSFFHALNGDGNGDGRRRGGILLGEGKNRTSDGGPGYEPARLSIQREIRLRQFLRARVSTGKKKFESLDTCYRRDFRNFRFSLSYPPSTRTTAKRNGDPGQMKKLFCSRGRR